MPPHRQPLAPDGPSRSMTHRIMLIVALVVALTQAVAWADGSAVAGLAAAVLVAMGAGFAAADLLDLRGRARAAVLLTSLTIMVSVPLIAALFEPGSAAILMAPVAFILALPYLRGRQLALVGAVGVALTALAAAMHLLETIPGSNGGTVARDALVVLAGVSAVTTVLFGLAWQAARDREAATTRIRSLLADLPVGIARTDPKGRLVEANEAYARMFGYPDPASMVGVASGGLVVDPSDLTRLAGALDSGTEVVNQVECRRLDGTTLWIRFTSRAALDEHGDVLWYDTVTEDVTAERRTQADKDRFAATLEAADLAIVSQTTDAVILGWNGVAAQLYGWDESIRGKTAYDVSPPDEWEAIRASTARVAAGETIGPFEIERFYRGRTVFLAITVVPVRDARGAVTSIATVGRDITADVRLRDERTRLEEQLRDAQALEATGRLAGGVAHDFNNLLTGIRGHASELLDELRPGSPAHAAAEQILRSTAEASDLTHQLLAFARLQVLQPEVVNLDAVIAEQVPTLRRLVGGSIDLVVDAGRVPPLVMADRGQLVEVLAHLVLNAREAMPDGGTVRLVTRVAPATAGLEPSPDAGTTPGASPNEVVLRVEDTGSGIAPEVLPHVFEPFFTTKEMGRGTGMGLSMVHGVVRQSGGRIEIATDTGGTAMIVRLPLASAMPSPTPARVSAERSVDGARILLVDDEPVVRTIARRILGNAGFEVVEAADAAQARAVMEGGGPFDLLVTDVIMPGMRGPELARLVHESHPDLPVLFVSGFTGEDALEGLEPGRVAFLAKPFAMEQLLEAVRGLLRRRVAGPPAEPRQHA